MNLVVVHGRVAAPAELSAEPARRKARLPVAVQSPGPPRRVDVIPVTVLDPPPEVAETEPGTAISVIGRLHRRFWAGPSGRQSRLEVVASHVSIASTEMDET